MVEYRLEARTAAASLQVVSYSFVVALDGVKEGVAMEKHSTDTPRNEDEQLWIGWKWFDYHAKQRLEVFKFFITVYGAILAFSVGFLQPGLTFVSIALSAFAAILSIIFWQLDVRSRQLTEIGERIISARWKELRFDEKLNPIVCAQTAMANGLRYKHALLVLYALSLLFSVLIFGLSVYATHYPIKFLWVK